MRGSTSTSSEGRRSKGASVRHSKFTGRGGALFVIANDLEYGEARPEDSLELTVAHELFHIVQDAYFHLRIAYTWFIEGTASAMERLVYPEIREERIERRIAIWLSTIGMPLYASEGDRCERCYGQALWWAYLLSRARVVPTLFELVRTQEAAGTGAAQGDAAHLLVEAAPTLPTVWSNFAVELLRERKPRAWSVSATMRTTRRFSVAPLAISYLGMRIAGQGRRVVVRVARGSAVRVRAVQGSRVLTVRSSQAGGRVVYRVTARAATLVVSNGGMEEVSYTVGAEK